MNFPPQPPIHETKFTTDKSYRESILDAGRKQAIEELNNAKTVHEQQQLLDTYHLHLNDLMKQVIVQEVVPPRVAGPGKFNLEGVDDGDVGDCEIELDEGDMDFKITSDMFTKVTERSLNDEIVPELYRGCLTCTIKQ